MQRNILPSELVSGPDNPGDKSTNQHTLLPSWNFKLNYLGIAWNLRWSKCLSLSAEFGEGKVRGQKDAVPVKWRILDHPESWMGPLRPSGTSRLPPVAPCFHPPHQIPHTRQTSKPLLMALSQPEISFISGQFFLQALKANSSLEPDQIYALITRHCFLISPIKATPSLLLLESAH